MTTTSRAPGTSARAAGSSPVRSPVVLGALGAAQAATASLLCVLLPVVLVWVASPSTGAVWTEAVRTGAGGWLLAHHGGVALDGGGRLSLVPLGLTALPVFWCWSGGRRLGEALRTVAATSLRRHGLRALGAFTAVYALLAAAVGLLTGAPVASPLISQAVLGAAVVAAAVAGTAMLRAVLDARDDTRGVARFSVDVLGLPPLGRAVVRAAAVALGTWVAAAAALTATALVLGWDRVATLREALAPGWAGAGLGLVELAYLPTAVIWAGSWLAGPGFAVGAGTSVGPAAVVLGPLPALPLLGALPEPGPTPTWLWAGAVVPVLAGALAGAFLARATPQVTRTVRLGLAPVVGATAGVGAGLLAWAATGGVGHGRMLELGPAPGWVALALAVEVTAGCFVAVLLATSGQASGTPVAASPRNPSWAPGLRRQLEGLPSWLRSWTRRS